MLVARSSSRSFQVQQPDASNFERIRGSQSLAAILIYDSRTLRSKSDCRSHRNGGWRIHQRDDENAGLVNAIARSSPTLGESCSNAPVPFRNPLCTPRAVLHSVHSEGVL